jgi:hypothetical protein
MRTFTGPLATALAVLGSAACALAPQAAAKGRPSEGTRVLNHAAKVFAEVNTESHLTGDDFHTQLSPDCDDARLNRFDPKKKAESDAFYGQAAQLVRESIQTDFEPAFKGAHSDYAELQSQLLKLAQASGPGARHHALIEAALTIGRAQRGRNQEVKLWLRLQAAQTPPKYICEDDDLANAVFGEQRGNEKLEHEALQTLEYALRQKPTSIHALKPVEFKVHVVLTLTEKAKMAYTGEGTCNEESAVSGAGTLTTDFPAFVVNPNGSIKATTLTSTASGAGSWSMQGEFAPEGQCDHLKTFSCSGTFAPAGEGTPPTSLLIEDEQSALARSQVELPEMYEAGTESCPDGGSFQAYIPEPLIGQQFAAHAKTLDFPIDGSALRGRFEPLHVESSIEHLGPDEPGIDCTTLIQPSTTCNDEGTSVKSEITLEPVGGD